MKMTTLESVQQLYAYFGQGNIPGIIDMVADQVQWEKWTDNRAQKAGVPWLQEKHDKAGVMEFFQCIGAELNITDFKVRSIMVGGNQAVAEIEIEADVLTTGEHFREEELHFWTFNEAGKVTRFRHYLDTHKHMLAAKVV